MIYNHFLGRYRIFIVIYHIQYKHTGDHIDYNVILEGRFTVTHQDRSHILKYSNL